MVETGERVESREPQDHIAKPGVDVRDGFAQIMRNADERGDLDAREQRQGMPFEPCAGDSCQRDGQTELRALARGYWRTVNIRNSQPEPDIRCGMPLAPTGAGCLFKARIPCSHSSFRTIKLN